MKGKLLLLAIIVGAIAFGAYIWFPSLNIPSKIDFDQATLNTKLAFTFNINNNTYSEIQITNYQTGCPCNSLHVKDDMGNLVNLRGIRIKPRTQQTVCAYFTIIPENGQTIYSKPVIISTNLPSIPQLFTVVTVKRVNGIIEAKPDLLTSTNAVADQASYQKITLYNGSDRNYIINHFESPGPVKFECPNLQLPFELSPSRAIELNFKITPLKSGLLEGKLSVYCQDHIISVPYAIRAAGTTYLSDSIFFFHLNIQIKLPNLSYVHTRILTLKLCPTNKLKRVVLLCNGSELTLVSLRQLLP